MFAFKGYRALSWFRIKGSQNKKQKTENIKIDRPPRIPKIKYIKY